MEFSGWSLMALHYSLIFTINYELLMTLAESEFSEARGVSGIIPSTQCRGTTINHLVRPAKSERSETRSVGGSESQVSEAQRTEICWTNYPIHDVSGLETIPGTQCRGTTIHLRPDTASGHLRQRRTSMESFA